MFREPLPVAEPEFKNRTDLDVIKDMIESQGTFVSKRIPKSDRAVFLAQVNQLRTLCDYATDHEHLQRKFYAFKEIELKPTNILIRMFTNPFPTKLLAYDMVEEIIHSVHVRFIDGGSKTFVGLLEERFKSRSIAVSPEKPNDKI